MCLLCVFSPLTVLWVRARWSLKLARPTSHASVLSVPGASLEPGHGPCQPQSAPWSLGPGSSYPTTEPQNCHPRAAQSISRPTPHPMPAPYGPHHPLRPPALAQSSQNSLAFGNWSLQSGWRCQELACCPCATRGRQCPCLNPLGSSAPRVGPTLVLDLGDLRPSLWHPASPGPVSRFTPRDRWEGVLPMGSDLENPSWDTPPHLPPPSDHAEEWSLG